MAPLRGPSPRGGPRGRLGIDSSSTGFSLLLSIRFSRFPRGPWGPSAPAFRRSARRYVTRPPPRCQELFSSPRKFFSIDPLNFSLEKPGNRHRISLPEKRSSNIILTWPYERKTQFCEILKKVWATPKKHAIRLFELRKPRTDKPVALSGRCCHSILCANRTVASSARRSKRASRSPSATKRLASISIRSMRADRTRRSVRDVRTR